MFVKVNSFPSCTTTVFSWFPGFSLVQVMFGCTRLEASQIKCKVSPSRTVVSPLIPVILNGTKSNQTITCKLQGQLLNGSISNTLKVIIHDCVVPENIHTPTTEGIGNSRGVGGSKSQEIPEGMGVRGEIFVQRVGSRSTFFVRRCF